MRFHWLLATVLSISSPLITLPSTDAFTYGPYLPNYLCGPAIAQPNGNIVGKPTAEFPTALYPNGAPKALAGVLAKFVEFTPNGEFQTVAQDSRVIVGAFHNANAAGQTISFGGTNPIALAANVTDPAILKGAIPIAAQVNILQVGRIQALPAATAAVPDPANPKGDPLVPALTAINAITPPTAITFTMTANELILLTLQSRNNVPAQLSSAPLTLAQFAQSQTKPVLDGALVYAQDANNNRVGKFTTGGPMMTLWAACGPDQNGVVHNQLLSADSNTYSSPQFFLPWQFPLLNPGVQTITFMGAAVTDNGFGYHQTKFTVTPQQLTLDIHAINAKDVLACAINAPPCFAACVDCAQKGGSTPAKQTKIAQPTCTPNMTIGDPAKGQATIWTAACKINNVVTPVAPAAAIVVPPPKAKDASGNDMPLTPDQQNLEDQVTAAIMLAANTSMPTMDGTNTNTNTNTGGSSCTSNPMGNNVNNAQSSSSHSLFTTVTVVLGALFASIRQ